MSDAAAAKEMIRVEGDLTDQTGREMFAAAQGCIRRKACEITVDLSSVKNMDSLGGAWLGRLMANARLKKVNVEISGATGQAAELLDMLAPTLSAEPAPGTRRIGLFEDIGGTFLNALSEAREAFELVIEAVYWAVIGPLTGKGLRIENTLDEMHEMGVRAVGIVCLINFLLGLIIAMLSIAQVEPFGLGIYVATVVVIGFARELGAVMTAVVVSARSGAAIAAEMATMVVQEEIDSLRGMGLNPARFLVAPKLVAMIAVMPCLTVLAMFSGVAGGTLVGVVLLKISTNLWLQQTQTYLKAGDIAQGLIKCVVFAFVITLVGCHNGLRVKGGARGVGLATTRSVVMDIFFIIVADMIFAILFYFVFK
ncbi:MAG TPA: ABC transporter permease [Candidatus Brocadiia bacterium]|nr:ABC transporter permease [Candidatus Brocadiia bacterium]